MATHLLKTIHAPPDKLFVSVNMNEARRHIYHTSERCSSSEKTLDELSLIIPNSQQYQPCRHCIHHESLADMLRAHGHEGNVEHTPVPSSTQKKRKRLPAPQDGEELVTNAADPRKCQAAKTCFRMRFEAAKWCAYHRDLNQQKKARRKETEAQKQAQNLERVAQKDEVWVSRDTRKNRCRLYHTLQKCYSTVLTEVIKLSKLKPWHEPCSRCTAPLNPNADQLDDAEQEEITHEDEVLVRKGGTMYHLRQCRPNAMLTRIPKSEALERGLTLCSSCEIPLVSREAYREKIREYSKKAEKRSAERKRQRREETTAALLQDESNAPHIVWQPQENRRRNPLYHSIPDCSKARVPLKSCEHVEKLKPWQEPCPKCRPPLNLNYDTKEAEGNRHEDPNMVFMAEFSLHYHRSRHCLHARSGVVTLSIKEAKKQGIEECTDPRCRPVLSKEERASRQAESVIRYREEHYDQVRDKNKTRLKELRETTDYFQTYAKERMKTSMYVHSAMQTVAAKKRIPFKMSRKAVAEIVVQPCYWCGCAPPEHRLNGLDRVDNDHSIGYISGNVVSSCAMCNYMKCDLNVTVFLDKCKQINEHFGPTLRQCTGPFVQTLQQNQCPRLPGELQADVKKRMIRYAERAAEERDLQFELTVEQYHFLKNQPCVYCGKEGGQSIDRIDSDRHYTWDNCVSACADCNYLKREFSIQDWVDKCTAISQMASRLPPQGFEEMVFLPTDSKTTYRSNYDTKQHLRSECGKAAQLSLQPRLPDEKKKAVCRRCKRAVDLVLLCHSSL
eukprot:GILK01010649.1.p1 GENE.GILK01010649.1~~GILK01010649.1.p1  ORF type:complete len:852 (-),score=90.47 GILK01010649.1:52-2406(-)